MGRLKDECYVCAARAKEHEYGLMICEEFVVYECGATVSLYPTVMQIRRCDTGELYWWDWKKKRKIDLSTSIEDDLLRYVADLKRQLETCHDLNNY